MQEEAVSAPKKRKKLVRILSIIGTAVVGLLFLLASVNVIDRLSKYSFPLFGLRANVIVSGSMSYDKSKTTSEYEFQQLQINDVVLTYQCSYDDVKVGDIITYYTDKGLVCHRVVEKYQNEEYRFFVTKGDNNDLSDLPVEYKDFKGKVISVIPQVGGAVLFFQSYYFIIALGFSGFLVFGIVYIYRYTEDKKKEKEKNNDNSNDFS